MGLLNKINEQICKPCRKQMDTFEGVVLSKHYCDEGCALHQLWIDLDNFKIEGKLSQATELRKNL